MLYYTQRERERSIILDLHHRLRDPSESPTADGARICSCVATIYIYINLPTYRSLLVSRRLIGPYSRTRCLGMQRHLHDRCGDWRDWRATHRVAVHEATCGDLPLDDGDECENLLSPESWRIKGYHDVVSYLPDGTFKHMTYEQWVAALALEILGSHSSCSVPLVGL